MACGYAYDAFGRTTAMPGGRTVAYYTNDLVRQQTVGDSRQTWMLDSAGRFRGWTTESNASGTWTQTGSRTNHYGDVSDSPRWITDQSGGVARIVAGLAGGLSATTGASGAVILQLTNLHGDVNLLLPLDTSVAPTALSADEYGNRRVGTEAVRYGWLGAEQRSAETATGALLMGVRLYNPETGRFLSTDPAFGGSRNAYEYAGANPVNHLDLDGRWYKKRTWYYSWGRLTGEYWSPSSWWSGSSRIRVTATLSKRWTGRIADYGWYLYIITGAIGFFEG
ncbi:RHS repeat-associated core domain-containing protein [Streptomyces regalis]|uniref:RHS repeat-associated core domain-containing protein n=1 Tax=Streptomyces regalis TaxID=68262 RepID=A0A0X3VH88_9ACTN|nr:RHS repeat-associated core domain-containing protein [Streptomyces regalis]KUL44060.1 hypothetical protein ADL12_05800 [Streptomyces regalis]